MSYRISYGRKKKKLNIWPYIMAMLIAGCILLKQNMDVTVSPISNIIQIYRAVDTFADEISGGLGWHDAVHVYWNQLIDEKYKSAS